MGVDLLVCNRRWARVTILDGFVHQVFCLVTTCTLISRVQSCRSSPISGKLGLSSSVTGPGFYSAFLDPSVSLLMG